MIAVWTPKKRELYTNRLTLGRRRALEGMLLVLSAKHFRRTQYLPRRRQQATIVEGPAI